MTIPSYGNTNRAAYRIETDRLVLRCWLPTDGPQCRAVLDRNDAHLRPLIPFMNNEPRSLLGTADWLRQHRAEFDRDESYRYALFKKGDGQLLGEVMLLDRYSSGDLEVGYWIDKDHCGRGYATEATAVCTSLALDHFDFGRVDLMCAPENAASAAVARKLGYIHEATLRNRVIDTEGNPRDLMIWSLTQSEWSTTQMASSVQFFDCMNVQMNSRNLHTSR